MIVTCWARIIPPPTQGWNSSGFDLPRFLLASGEHDTVGDNGFTTCEQAATIAADVTLFGRAPGTLASLIVTDGIDVHQRWYTVNVNGRLSSVPETELDENGIPFAVYLRAH